MTRSRSSFIFKPGLGSKVPAVCLRINAPSKARGEVCTLPALMVAATTSSRACDESEQCTSNCKAAFVSTSLRLLGKMRGLSAAGLCSAPDIPFIKPPRLRPFFAVPLIGALLSSSGVLFILSFILNNNQLKYICSSFFKMRKKIANFFGKFSKPIDY